MTFLLRSGTVSLVSVIYSEKPNLVLTFTLLRDALLIAGFLLAPVIEAAFLANRCIGLLFQYQTQSLVYEKSEIRSGVGLLLLPCSGGSSRTKDTVNNVFVAVK